MNDAHCLTCRENYDSKAWSHAICHMGQPPFKRDANPPRPTVEDVQKFARQIADKANECCHRSDGWEEALIDYITGTYLIWEADRKVPK